MKFRNFTQLAAAVFFLPGSPLQAGRYGPQIFDYPDGSSNLGDGTTLASSDGTAAVEGGTLTLTGEGVSGTHASFRIPALAASAEGWTATFEFTLTSQRDRNPGEGFSFCYGAIPAFEDAEGDPTAPEAHGLAEEGWGANTAHLAFEFDTRDDGEQESGFNISRNGVDLAFENRPILSDGRTAGSVWLSWHPASGASMSVDLGQGLLPVFTNVPTPGFDGEDTHLFVFSARTGQDGATQGLEIDNVQITTIPPGLVILPEPVISEFMAENQETLEDGFCRSSDWLELFNSTAETINFEGWHLTDDPAELARWQLPDLTLRSNERIIIFASNRDQTAGELHTDFRLNRDGGYLALVKPDGTTIAHSYLYPPQAADISYGLLMPGQTMGAFRNPTPGAPNNGPQGEFLLEKVVFSHESQVITGELQLELRSSLPEATIRYTTDATSPNRSWRTYNGPIPVSRTTRVTARLEQAGKEPGPLRDRTFVLLDDSMRNVRSNLPLIIVDSFGRRIDNESSANSQNPLRPVHGLFIDVDPVTGVARPTDLPDFEGRGGMRVRGQTSSGFPKKQYSFETWDSEGNDKDVSIFGYPAESDWIIHAPYSDKSLMRNKIVYETSREMGYPASRTRFVELYYNANGDDVSTADYRGVYVFMEKIKRGDDRLKIKKLENCDNERPEVSGGYIFKKDKGQSVDVTFNSVREGHIFSFVEPDQPTTQQRSWLDTHIDQFENNLHSSRFLNPTRGYASFIDVQSFIDTHLWVEVYKNIDGYRLSSYFHKDRGRKIVASPVWDYNLSLGNADYLQGEFPNGWYYSQVGAGGYPWYGRLFLDPEFVIRYWDRWFELRKGIFATDSMMARIDAHSALLSGPARRNFTKWRVLGSDLWPNADSWTPPAPYPGSDRNLAGSSRRRSYGDEVDWMKGWLSARLDWIDSQHDKPPSFDRDGGAVEGGSQLIITNLNAGGGQIYYTTDGSDPRLAANRHLTTVLRAGSECHYHLPTNEVPGWNTVEGPATLGNWDNGVAGLGFEVAPGPYATLINTQLPMGTTSAYARFTFELVEQSTLDALTAVNLRLQYDDGFVAYLNGVQVASANAPALPAWNSLATAQRSTATGANLDTFSITPFKNQLRVGTNVLAIQVFSSGNTSKALLCSPELVATSSDDAPSVRARLYDGPLTIDQSQVVRARVKKTGGWSPIRSEAFLVGGAPAGPGDLAVTELNYRPSPAILEANRGYDQRSDFEYLEVMNISDTAIDLTGVSFTDGIEFEFDLGSIRYLAPRERVLIVANRDAFELRYANLTSRVRVAGEYRQNLSNDGETITLSAADGSVIRSFTYNDKNPWSELADGDGFSLVLRNPLRNPDHSNPLNWRASAISGGAPGGDDSSEFRAGSDDFLQYAIAAPGSVARLPDMEIRASSPGTHQGGGDFLAFSYTRNRLADDVEYTVQQSSNLRDWFPGTTDTLDLIQRIENADGTDTLSFRVRQEVRNTPQLYLRLAVERR
ncbi:MAG: hypothetical protein CMO40_04725 [Verrucomicrobiaceae bacterium]|nr:hypothetical protein [Verrucomicrobiaceae bacterium]